MTAEMIAADCGIAAEVDHEGVDRHVVEHRAPQVQRLRASHVGRKLGLRQPLDIEIALIAEHDPCRPGRSSKRPGSGCSAPN